MAAFSRIGLLGMSLRMWKVAKDIAVAKRLDDELLHERALQEMRNGDRRDGLWAKALIEGQGDETRAQAAYLRLLVTSLRDEIYLVQRLKEMAAEQRMRVAPTSDSVRSGDTKREAESPATVSSKSAEEVRHEVIGKLRDMILSGDPAESTYKVVAEMLGGRLDGSGLFSVSYSVVLNGSTVRVGGFEKLRAHFISEIIPVFDSQLGCISRQS